MIEWAELLKAIASILWPAFAFTTLFAFRRQIANLIPRIRKGKILGQELELAENLDKLEVAAKATIEEVPALLLPASDDASASPQPPMTPEAEHDGDETVSRVLELAGTSPKAALLLLASELERSLTRLLASVGKLQGRDFVPFREGMSILRSHAGLPHNLMASVDLFYGLRNRLVHGRGVTEDDILRAIDSGVSIYRALMSVPHENHRVVNPGTPVYYDAACSSVIAGAKGVILESYGPDGLARGLRIFPTTRTHFRAGTTVAWEWSAENRFGEAWYRDDETNQPRYAWTSSMEFIGRNLDDL